MQPHRLNSPGRPRTPVPAGLDTKDAKDEMHANYSAEVLATGERYELRITGEIDLDAADTVVAAGTAGLAEPDVRTLVLDLSGVTFIDSTGLGSLVRLRKAARAGGRDLVLRSPSERVAKMLEISALASVFDIAD